MARVAVRVMLTACCLVLLIWVAVAIARAMSTTVDQIKFVDYDPARFSVFQFTRESLERYFQMAVLIVGALMSVAIIKQDARLTRRDVPEIIMVVVAFLLFIAFFYFNEHYSELLTRTYWDVLSLPGKQQMPNPLDSPYIELYREAFVKCFYSGLIVSGISIFSLCELRGA